MSHRLSSHRLLILHRFTYITTPIIAGFHFGDVLAQYHVAAFTTITVCFKILSLFRGNSYATTFTRIIFRMMRDSRYVILIIFVNIVGFAVAFNMLYRGRMPNFVSVDSGLFSMFLAIFGQLDFVQVGGVITHPRYNNAHTICISQKDPNATIANTHGIDMGYADFGVSVVLIIAYLSFVVILVLNMLIAVLGKSFNDTLKSSIKASAVVLQIATCVC